MKKKGGGGVGEAYIHHLGIKKEVVVVVVESECVELGEKTSVDVAYTSFPIDSMKQESGKHFPLLKTKWWSWLWKEGAVVTEKIRLTSVCIEPFYPSSQITVHPPAWVNQHGDE